MTHVRGKFAAIGSLAALTALTVGAALLSATEGPTVAAASPAPVRATGPTPTVPGAPGATAPDAPTGATGSTSPICDLASPPTAVTVTRSLAFPQNDISFVFPAQVVSTNGPAVAALARTLCALAPFPSGSFNCPADFGVTYLISFRRAAETVGAVTFDPSGCSKVTGLGPPRLSSPSFEDRLATALDLSTPTDYCDPFRGQLPTGPSSCGAPTP